MIGLELLSTTADHLDSLRGPGKRLGVGASSEGHGQRLGKHVICALKMGSGKQFFLKAPERGFQPTLRASFFHSRHKNLNHTINVLPKHGLNQFCFLKHNRI